MWPSGSTSTYSTESLTAKRKIQSFIEKIFAFNSLCNYFMILLFWFWSIIILFDFLNEEEN